MPKRRSGLTPLTGGGMAIDKGRKCLVIAGLLTVLVAALYGQTLGFDFIHFDEEQYVTKNSRVLSGLTWEGMRWAFANIEAGFWHPLTWLSLMLDGELFKLNAGGYHGTNVLWHLGNTLLLFWVLTRMTGMPGRSGLVAALFAVHPLHVESVAWIAQRKDVLSAFFWMLTMLCYIRYLERPGKGRYLLMLAAFVFGLMAKPMLVTLPLVLLLLDYWPLGRMQKGGFAAPENITRFAQRPFLALAWEKAPLVIIAVLFAFLAIYAEERAGAIPGINELSLPVRMTNALVSYALYLGKVFRPLELAVFYPHPGLWPLPQIALSGLLLFLITTIVLFRRRTFPWLIVGWFWYLFVLLPVSGLVQVGSHGMADRYAYLPMIGIYLILAWGGWEVLRIHDEDRRKIVYTAYAGIMIMACTIVAWNQLQYWQNSITLFSRAIDVTRNNYLAHNNLGAVFITYGFPDAAERHLRRALAIKPTYAVANNNLGNVMLGRGRYDEAIGFFQEAIRSNPTYGSAHRNLGDAYLRKGDFKRAISSYKIALIYDNRNAEIYNNLGAAMIACNDLSGAAVRQFEMALRIKPGYEPAAANLKKVKEITSAAGGKP